MSEISPALQLDDAVAKSPERRVLSETPSERQTLYRLVRDLSRIGTGSVKLSKNRSKENAVI